MGSYKILIMEEMWQLLLSAWDLAFRFSID